MGRLGRTDTLRILLGLLTGVALISLTAGCGERDVEKTLGELSAASVESAYEVDRDPLINDWLNNIGQTLVSHSRRQDIPYSFKVVRTDLVNAFAAPYGHIYVTSGFLDFAESEDEAWVVVGHETGHVVERHSISALKRSLLWSILTQIIRGENETIGDAVGLGLGLLSLRYSRDDEYEADDIGTQLAWRAGYDPRGGLDFFERLMTEVEKHRPARWEVYFMTHPPTEERIKRQLRRPELDPARADSMVQIARGYVRRGQPAMAVQLLASPGGDAPSLPEVQTLLGDAHAARGEYDLARAYFARAASVYAQQRLTLLANATPPTLSGIDAADRAAAGELAARVAEIETLAGKTRAAQASYAAQTGEVMTGLVKGVTAINRRLLDLAETEQQVTDATQELVIRGNTAITRATEPVYVLESVNRDLQEVGGEVEALAVQCRVALNQAQAGVGNPEDVAALREALAELKQATATLDLAMQEAPGALAQVQAARSGADNVAGLMELVVRRDDPNDLAREQLRLAAENAQQVGTAALQAVNQARRQSTEARGHALVARLNLLGTQATPPLQALYDRQVAHLLLVPEAAVRAVRSSGLGYGEAAVAIAAARSLGADPTRFVPAVAGDLSPVSAAMESGAALGNANVLLKFLAHAMEIERTAQAAR
jgi:predicted Zn-dependent protease